MIVSSTGRRRSATAGALGFIAFAAFSSLNGAAMADADMSGRAVMDETSARHDAPFEFEQQEMTLIDASGAEEVRTLKRYAREDDAGFKYLMVFHAPSGVEGVALLTWQNDDADDDQFLYLPSMGREIKRIAKGGKRNYFMGTDFTFEDLVSEDRDKFSYERMEDGSFDGAPAFIVEVRPIDEELKRSSGYGMRRFTVLKDSFFIAQIDFFDRRDRFIKRQVATDYGPVEGREPMWRAATLVMENEKENHKTRVVTTERSFAEDDVPERNFTQRFITSGRHLR